MKTAYLYIRVSTDEQADTGYSQRYQEETLRRYCEIQGIVIKGIYIEDHSAKNFNRPEFTRMLIMLKKYKGVAELLLFTKWDRFSRNAGDAYQMIHTLNKIGVDPQAIEQPLNLEIPENKMMLAFYLAAPEVENDRRALNVIGGMRRAKKEGRFLGKAPMGYRNRNIDGKKSIVIDPDQGAIMRWVFEEIAKGVLTVRSVFLMARQKGLCSHSGKPVGKTPFWNALRNPVYIGKIVIPAYKGESEDLIVGNHMPLISEQVFYAVQDVLDGRKRTRKVTSKMDDRFPLRGFLSCPSCGKILTASSSKGRNGYFNYYHCYQGCKTRFKSELVNDSFKRELARWKPDPVINEMYHWVLQDMYRNGDRMRQERIRKINLEVNKVSEHLKKVRKMRISEELDADDYRAEKKECEESLGKLEGELSSLVRQDDLQPQIQEAYELLSNIDKAFESDNNSLEWKRDLIGSMFPEKLEFTGESFRTAKVNEVAQILFNMGAAFSEIKMGQIRSISEVSHLVDP